MSIEHKRPVTLVSFSGVDGAGKSTQIQMLRAGFEGMGRTVDVVPFWDRIACLTQVREGAGHKIFKGEKGVGSPEAPVNRRDKNVRSWPMSFVRLCLYLLDAWSTRATVKQALRSGYDLVIFDRYIYDELANLNLHNPLMRAYARLIMVLTPRPHASLVLDADPLQARARKPEYPLEFIYINRQAYMDLSRLLGKIAVVAPGTVEQVHAQVMREVLSASGNMQGTAQDDRVVVLERAG